MGVKTMPNSYVSLDALKGAGVLNITGDEHDERLLAVAETASRAVDRYCNRSFYVLSAARRFDGAGGPRLLVPDLICVNRDGLRTDEDGDGRPDTVWPTSDFRLLPANADPDSGGNPASRPYTAIEAAGDRTRFPAGRGSVRVSGKWGWWRRLRLAGTADSAVSEAVDTSSLELADGSEVGPGQTILVGSEQMYVEARRANTLNVRRGVNGTARMGHDAGARVSVFEYPLPVSEAALTLAAILWRRGSSAYEALDPARGGSPAGMDPLAALMLAPFRKPAVGVGV